MLPFKLVLFDLGNTLIYFDGDWPTVLGEGAMRLTDSLISSGYQLDKSAFTADFLKTLRGYFASRNHEYIEKTTGSVLRSLLAAHGQSSVYPGHIRTALDAMYAVSQPHWRVEPDSISTLESLQALGCKLGLISNAGDPIDAHALVDNAGLRPHFKKVWISAEIGFRKPHARMFEMALDYFQIRPKDAVMVGDSLGEDILGANNMGIASIWLTRRSDSPENRENINRIVPDHSVKNLDELPATLMNW